MSSVVIRIFSSLGLFVGVILGAGMFALPYAMMQSGVVWGSVYLALAFSTVTVLHLLYAEFIVDSGKKHRLPGYARVYLGPLFGRVALYSAFIGFYGSMLAYGVLAGIFLETLTHGALSAYVFSILFFVVGGIMLLGDLKRIGEINFFLTLPLIVFIIVLWFLARDYIYVSHIREGSGLGGWFSALGIFLFAFAGASGVPDAVEVMGDTTRRVMRRMIVWGTLVPLILYVVFIYTVAGVSGAETSRDAIAGLVPFLGSTAVVIGACIGLLAVYTSFLSMGADLKKIYAYDYGLGETRGWFFASFLPPLLFISGITNFISIISFVGGVAVAIDGATILLLAEHVRKRRGHVRDILFNQWVFGFVFAILFFIFAHEITGLFR